MPGQPYAGSRALCWVDGPMLVRQPICTANVYDTVRLNLKPSFGHLSWPHPSTKYVNLEAMGYSLSIFINLYGRAQAQKAETPLSSKIEGEQILPSVWEVRGRAKTKGQWRIWDWACLCASPIYPHLPLCTCYQRNVLIWETRTPVVQPPSP